MVLRELITKWGIKADTTGLKQMEDGINDIKSSLAKIATIGVAAAGTLFGIAKSTADAGDEIAKTSKQIGISAQSLQELSFAAQIGGASQQELSTGVMKFSRSIVEARDGVATYLDSFKRLGISQSILNDKNIETDKLLEVVADKFKSMPDGAEKTATAMELFGRSGAKLIPMLNEGSSGIGKLRKEANDLGIVMGDKLLSDSEEFQDSMLRMKSTIIGIRNEVGARLIPIINKITDSIKKWFIANKQIVVSKLNDFLDTLISLSVSAWNILKTLYTSVSGLVEIFGGWESVIRGVSIAMMIMLGAQVLSGIGSLAMGIVGLIASFKSLGFAAMLANAKIMIIPILIGAAIVAIGLLIEDLYRFARGENSVFGLIVDGAKEMISVVDEWFSGLPSVVQGIIAFITAPIRALMNGVKSIGGFFGALHGGDFGGAIDAIKEGISNTFSIPDTLTGALGFASPTAGATSNNKSISQKNDIVVNVPAGMNREDAIEATRSGVEDSLSTLLRQTDRAVSSPILE